MYLDITSWMKEERKEEQKTQKPAKIKKKTEQKVNQRSQDIRKWVIRESTVDHKGDSSGGDRKVVFK